MPSFQIKGADGETTFSVDTTADWTSCLITGVIAALPCFLEAFMKCLNNGGGGSSDYQPGDRERCN